MSTIRFRDSSGYVRTGTLDGETIQYGSSEIQRAEASILAPAQPSKIVCVGLNYADHAAEQNEPIPDRPLLFLKPPNAVAHPHSEVTLPSGKDRIDYEAELAVVIDKQAKEVPAEDALSYVRGFTCLDDLSNRDDQNREQNWIRGKAFDNAAPMGPVLASPTAVPEDASISLSVNGETRQHSSRDQFIFSIPELIEEITTYLTLEPGDVISTGTPSGVGPVSDGDTISISIDGIGTLTHSVQIPD